MSPSIPEFVPKAGGSIISRNALDGKAPIRWAYREEQENPVDNGWRFLSVIDTEEFLGDSDNMTVVDFNSVVALEPAVLPLLHLPVGTDVTIARNDEGRIFLLDSSTGDEIEL